MKKAIWMSVGFLLFILGFSALVLSVVGVKLYFLVWIDGAGPLIGLFIRIFMIVGGIVLVYLTATDWRAEEE